MRGGKKMRIYLIESNKGNIQLATKIYTHEGSHTDIVELSIEEYNNIKSRMNDFGMFTDDFGNRRFFRNEGVGDEVYFAGGIRKIAEKHIETFDDLFKVCSNKKICNMNKVRLMEKFKEVFEKENEND